MENWKNTMLCSPSDVKAQTAVNYNVSDVEIGAAIRTAQAIYLQEVIGTALMEKLQRLLYNSATSKAGGIDAPECAVYAEAWRGHIRPLLVAMTVGVLIPQIAIKVRNIGVSRNSDTGVSPASLDEIRYRRSENDTMVAELSTEVSFYFKRVVNEIPELTASCYAYPAVIGRRFANAPMWLGGYKL